MSNDKNEEVYSESEIEINEKNFVDNFSQELKIIKCDLSEKDKNEVTAYARLIALVHLNCTIRDMTMIIITQMD